MIENIHMLYHQHIRAIARSCALINAYGEKSLYAKPTYSRVAYMEKEGNAFSIPNANAYATMSMRTLVYSNQSPIELLSIVLSTKTLPHNYKKIQ